MHPTRLRELLDDIRDGYMRPGGPRVSFELDGDIIVARVVWSEGVTEREVFYIDADGHIVAEGTGQLLCANFQTNGKPLWAKTPRMAIDVLRNEWRRARAKARLRS